MVGCKDSSRAFKVHERRSACASPSCLSREPTNHNPIEFRFKKIQTARHNAVGTWYLVHKRQRLNDELTVICLVLYPRILLFSLVAQDQERQGRYPTQSRKLSNARAEVDKTMMDIQAMRKIFKATPW
jgi:hypothetical protein